MSRAQVEHADSRTRAATVAVGMRRGEDIDPVKQGGHQSIDRGSCIAMQLLYRALYMRW